MEDYSDSPDVISQAFPYVMTEIAAVAVFAYDIIICMDKEIEYVWMTSWSIPKCLYFTSRYLGLAVFASTPIITFFAVPSRICQAYLPIQFLVLQSCACCCDGLLLMRVVAVFHHKRRLCLTLYCLYTLCYLVEAAMAIVNFVSSLRASPVPDEWDCTTTRHASGGNLLDTIVTLPILMFNLILFSFTLLHLLPYCREVGRKQTPLLTLLLEDGAIYFAIVCGALLLETICPVVTTLDMGVAWLVLIPMASNRLFLSLRAFAGRAGTGNTPPNPGIVNRCPEESEQEDSWEMRTSYLFPVDA